MVKKKDSQAQIARELGMSQANVTKLKKLGMPVSSAANAQAWRVERQNVAARKAVPSSLAETNAGPGIALSDAGGLNGRIDPDGGEGGNDLVIGELGGGVRFADGSGVDLTGVPNKIGSSGEAVVDVPSLPDESHDMARTRREIAEANLAEMREAEERGSLIRVDVVRSVFSVAMATAREALLQIPSRLAPLLAAETDPAAVQNALHGEIHRALLHLAGAADRLDQEEGQAT